MDTSDFKVIFLGQSVLRYQVPLTIYNTINSIYETNFNRLPKANPQLVGKIEKEHSLFFNGIPNNKMHPHNLLTQDVKQWFHTVMQHYLEWNKIKGYKMHLNSIGSTLCLNMNIIQCTYIKDHCIQVYLV